MKTKTRAPALIERIESPRPMNRLALAGYVPSFEESFAEVFGRQYAEAETADGAVASDDYAEVL